jgi:gluconolactonase
MNPIKNRVGAMLLAPALLLATPLMAQMLPGERAVTIDAIPGVIAAGAHWERLWAGFYTADGIVGTSDGGVLFAQEQTDSVRKLDANGSEQIYLDDVYGVGAVSLDSQGRLFAAERTCTEPLNAEVATCRELPRITMLEPQRRILARSFADGSTLGRVNDVIGDGNGGAFFTAGGAYHVGTDGVVTVVADQDLRSNGIMLSPDGRTLYVTNVTEVLAFDVARDGSTSNRRVLGTLDGDDGGDGMAVDADGRLYVTASAGVHVLSARGEHLGLIPTPRRPITLAFSGPAKRTLFVPQMGAIGPDGKAWSTPEGVRNTAMTIYTIELSTAGFAGRPK